MKRMFPREKISKLTPFLTLVILFLMFLYFFITFGTVIFSISGIYILFLFYAFSLPLISSLPYSFTYYFCLPSPFIGLWTSVILWMIKIGYANVFSAIVSETIVLIIVIYLHLFSVKRLFIQKIRISDLSRIGIGALSLILLELSIVLVNPFSLNPDKLGDLITLGSLWIGYLAFSMIYINETYRIKALANLLKTRNLDATISDIFIKLRQKYSKQTDDLELLEYYTRSSIDFFRKGDYESSFTWCYKIIREKTVVNPIEIVNDKMEGNEGTFSEIRTKLMHSRRKEERITPEDIKNIRKNLFDLNLRLFKRAFEFLNKLDDFS